MPNPRRSTQPEKSADESDAAEAGGAAPPTFEQALNRLEAIVHDLEDGRAGLAESLEAYEEGVRLLRKCHALLERAERRIELLTGVDAEGNAITQPFDDEAAATLEEKAKSRSAKRSKPRRAASGIADEEPASETSRMDEPRGLF